MIEDQDKIRGTVQVIVRVCDSDGCTQEEKTYDCTAGFTLSTIGTVVQREVYELLRITAGRHK